MEESLNAVNQPLYDLPPTMDFVKYEPEVYAASFTV
jgi:hypothetical protein